MDNPEILATLGTKDPGRRKIKHNITQKTKNMKNTALTKNRELIQVLAKSMQVLLLIRHVFEMTTK